MRRIVFLVLLFLSVTPARAAVVFEDDFSRGFDWTTVRNAAHYDPAVTCNTHEGPPQWKLLDGVAEMSIADSFPCSVEAVPKNDLIADLRAYQMSLRMFISEPLMDRNLLIRWQDADNQLGIHLFGTGIFGYKLVGGQTKTLLNSERSFNFQNNRWYNVKIEYDLSLRTIKLYLDDQLMLEMSEPANEPQIERGKPGLAASVGEVNHSFVRFDDYKIESLESGTKLSVPFFSQTDPRWKDQEYDRAAEWAPNRPTVGRWGCALASGVMVLRYLGITHLPDRSDLDPGSLNAWLIGQADGYYPGGDVNWRALTRLSHLHSENFGSMTLEMTYENPVDKLGWLKQQLNNARPVILEEPNHFVTAYGYGPGEADIAIHDPFYERFSLAEYQNAYLSGRLFTPSHTDLSAVTVITPLGTRLTMSDSNNSILPIVVIAEPERGYQIFDLAKPPEGLVTINIQASETPVPLWIAAYGHKGQAAVRQYLLPSTPDKSHIPVEFSATDGPNINLLPQPITFSPWSLTRLSLSQDFRSPALVRLILEHQAKLFQSNLVSDAEAIERGFDFQIQTAAKNGWLSPFFSDVIQNNYHRLLLEKFP